MKKRIVLFVASLTLIILGTVTALGRESAPPLPPDWGTCKYYCGGKPYNTLSQCAAACGGPSNCDQIC